MRPHLRSWLRVVEAAVEVVVVVEGDVEATVVI